MSTVQTSPGRISAIGLHVRLCAAAALVAVAGCATPPAPTPAVDPIRVSLEEAVARGSELPVYSNAADIKATPGAMTGERITIRDYVNSADALLSRVARARGMDFSVTGPEPHLPLLVTVDVAGASFEEFLSIVGKQFGQRADLVLGDRKLEIRYRGQP